MGKYCINQIKPGLYNVQYTLTRLRVFNECRQSALKVSDPARRTSRVPAEW